MFYFTNWICTFFDSLEGKKRQVKVRNKEEKVKGKSKSKKMKKKEKG